MPYRVNEDATEALGQLALMDARELAEMSIELAEQGQRAAVAAADTPAILVSSPGASSRTEGLGVTEDHVREAARRLHRREQLPRLLRCGTGVTVGN